MFFLGLLQPHILQSHPQREKQHIENLPRLCDFLKAEENNPHRMDTNLSFWVSFLPFEKGIYQSRKEKLFRVV